MLSQLFRSVNRQTFKSIQSQSFVKRFYTNEDLRQQLTTDDKDRDNLDNDFDETSRVYEHYYHKYYENYKKSQFSDKRQTNDSKYDNNYNNNNNKKFNSNSYSFSECKYHLLTLKLLENIGYIGATIFVGFHFKSPFYTKRYAIRNCDTLDTNTVFERQSTKICGNCKYCQSFLSKLYVLSAPIRKNYIFSKPSDRFLTSGQNNESFKEELNEEKDFNVSNDNSNNEIPLGIEDKSDPIDEICRQLQSASIDYIDRLNNMLGIALIQSEPEEAMKCWSSSKSSPKAIFNMGVAFESGRHSADGTVDLKRAYENYALSASMGHKQAIYNLSLFYLYGKGDIEVDLNKAETLLKRAAKLGVKPAEQFIEKLDKQRMAEIQSKPSMRRPVSAPNLLAFNTCFESFNNENSINKYQQNYSISYRV